MKDLRLLLRRITTRGYVDVVDAYKLVSYRVDLLGIKCYERGMTIEEELQIIYDELVVYWITENKSDIEKKLKLA